MTSVVKAQRAVAQRMRRRRLEGVMGLLERTASATGTCRVLDLGGEPQYWALLDRRRLEAVDAHVTLVNRQREEIDALRSDDPLFTFEEGDACDLAYADRSFDVVHSNSVIEHVGDWRRMKAFAGEVRRVADRYYVQTPNFGFPVEPHFSAFGFHWRSEQARARALLRRRHGLAPKARDIDHAMGMVQHARLLNAQQFGYLFPDAAIHSERLAGLTKSFVAVKG